MLKSAGKPQMQHAPPQAIAGSAVERQVGQVEQELLRLDKAITECGNIARELGERLAPVSSLRVSDPNPSKEAQEICPLAEKLREHRYAVEGITDALRYHWSCLEI